MGLGNARDSRRCSIMQEEDPELDGVNRQQSGKRSPLAASATVLDRCECDSRIGLRLMNADVAKSYETEFTIGDNS